MNLRLVEAHAAHSALRRHGAIVEMKDSAIYYATSAQITSAREPLLRRRVLAAAAAAVVSSSVVVVVRSFVLSLVC